ncbi:glutathione S-transferase [Mycena capillaripes]|nr:glutathione S-transferase [Mycena capillaripes]
MVLKLYCGPHAAGGSGVVAMVLAEKQIPFEHVLVDMANKEHKTPEFLAKHPFGQIPVIDDEGFILYESRAISRYLAEKYADQGTPLLPAELKEKALFEQAASVEFANFHSEVVKVIREAFGKRDETALAEAVGVLSAKLDVYEVILGKQKYLAGDELTLADLFHLAYGPLLVRAGVDIMTSKPNVTLWWNDITSRPTWINLTTDGIKSTGT